jgi:hypothetical protein
MGALAWVLDALSLANKISVRHSLGSNSAFLLVVSQPAVQLCGRTRSTEDVERVHAFVEQQEHDCIHTMESCCYVA